MKPTGIILAGGESSRMGAEKSLIKLEDSTFIETIHKILSPLCSDILISTNNKKVKLKGIKSIPDEIKNIGPVGGIYTCLKASSTLKTIIISVDTPFITTELIEYIYNKSYSFDVTICNHKNKLHPLIGIFTKHFLKILEKDIEENKYKTIASIRKSNYNILDITEDLPFYKSTLFLNFNNQNDLAILKTKS